MSGTTTIPGPHGTTISFSVSSGVSQAIAAAFANELAILGNAHNLEIQKVNVRDGHFNVPTVRDHKGLELVVKGGKAGETAVGHVQRKDAVTAIVDKAKANLVVDAAKDKSETKFLALGTGSATYFGGTHDGLVVQATGAGDQYFQALGTGGGNYAIGYSSGNNTVWATSGNDLISPGSGSNLVGLGSGNDTVIATGTDTILAGTGNATVLGGASDLVFGNQGSLLFAGGAAGTSATVVGSTGAETLFGAGGSGLFLVGTGAFLLVDGGGADTVVAGAGASSVTVIDNSGGSVVLFSGSDGNQLVAGGGNETLNALGTSGSNALWAGGGADSLIGGTGTNIFAFVAGGASVGGNDTVGNWTAKDALSLIGYTASQFSQTTVGGSAVITLSDGTKITIAGVPHISNIFHS